MGNPTCQHYRLFWHAASVVGEHREVGWGEAPPRRSPITRFKQFRPKTARKHFRIVKQTQTPLPLLPIVQTLSDEPCGVMVQSTVPPVGRYWVPFTPVSRGGVDAPDRRNIGKGIRGASRRLVSISKAGIYATPVNEHSAKPEGS
jgi:hypothetical protein